MATHYFTVDVEEYFQVRALEPHVPRSRWADMPSRVEASMDLLLGMLEARNAKGTFFTLGVVAKRHPDVIRRVAAAGHEVASHGWSHRAVTQLGPSEFRREVADSRALLSDITGQDVYGYRAPNFSILPGWEWAFDILLQEGYAYDSSVFPARASGGGRSTGVHTIRRTGGELVEVALTAARFGAVQVPAAGGAWFRLLPYALTRRALQQCAVEGRAGVFYIHPWELDPDQPLLSVGPVTRLRHYGGLRGARGRVERLLDEFEFTSIACGLGLGARESLLGIPA